MEKFHHYTLGRPKNCLVAMAVFFQSPNPMQLKKFNPPKCLKKFDRPPMAKTFGCHTRLACGMFLESSSKAFQKRITCPPFLVIRKIWLASPTHPQPWMATKIFQSPKKAWGVGGGGC
jgi:hypothetical protein